MTKRFSLKKNSNESGMALMWAIMLMALATFIIMPLLFFMQTTLTVNENVTESVKAQYAAEAGVEEALWRLSTPGITPQPGTTSIILPSKINGYWVSYNVAKPTGQAYSILTSTAYASTISQPSSIVRAKMNSGQFLFSYGLAARGTAAQVHDLWVKKSTIYSLSPSNPTNSIYFNKADLYSEGEMQFPSNSKVAGTLYAKNGLINSPTCSFPPYNVSAWGNCSWRLFLPWTQVNMWDWAWNPSTTNIINGNYPVNVGSDNVSIGLGSLYVKNGNLTITGNGPGMLLLKGRVYVDGTITKSGTCNIVDLGPYDGTNYNIFCAQGNISLINWNTKLSNSADLPIFMSLNGDITGTCASSKWICALLYAPNSANGFTSSDVNIQGAINTTGFKVQSGMTLEYPGDIQTKRQWPEVFGGSGSGNISAYSIQ